MKEICRNLKTAVAKYETYAVRHDDLLEGLFSAQSIAGLAELCAGDRKELQQGFLHDVRSRKYLLGVVQEADLTSLVRRATSDPLPRPRRCHHDLPARRRSCTVAVDEHRASLLGERT